jgi:hypothetical protein
MASPTCESARFSDELRLYRLGFRCAYREQST